MSTCTCKYTLPTLAITHPYPRFLCSFVRLRYHRGESTEHTPCEPHQPGHEVAATALCALHYLFSLFLEARVKGGLTKDVGDSAC